LRLPGRPARCEQIQEETVGIPLDLSFEATGAGAPLLILHGLFGSGTNWRGVARELAKGAQVFTVDLRNHGSSPWADSMSYLEMAQDVHAMIQSQGLKRPAVIGHSMGGKTAMALALTHPESVGRLIVVDIAPVAYSDRLSEYVRAMSSVDLGAASTRTEVQRSLARYIPEPGIVGFLMQNLVPRNEHFDWRLNLAGIGRSMPQLCDFPAELLQRRFDGPGAAITGALSDYVKAQDRAVFKALFPKLGLRAIEGAGHWVHADKPQEFLAVLKQALQADRPPEETTR
jgi:esterase